MNTPSTLFCIDSTNVLVANLKPLYWLTQALRFYHYLCSFWEPACLLNAMLMRPKKTETAVHGCEQSGSLFLCYFKGGKARYRRGHSVQYSGFKLATSTFVLSILELIFIATSHKHCPFTITLKTRLMKMFSAFARRKIMGRK